MKLYRKLQAVREGLKYPELLMGHSFRGVRIFENIRFF